MDDPSSSTSVTQPLLGSLPDGNMSVDKINGADSELAEEQMPVSEYRMGDRVAGLSTLIGASALAVITWVIVLTHNPKSLGWFAFHPTSQTLAISLFTFGIITLQPTSQPRTKAAGLERHQVIMLGLAFPVLTFGTGSMIHNKNLHEAAHFTTWHGTWGIITYVWIICQIILGAGSVWGGGSLFGGGMKAKLLWKYHRLSGYVLLFLLFATASVGGMFSTWASGNAVFVLRVIAYVVAPVAVLGGVYFRIRTSKMKFF